MERGIHCTCRHGLDQRTPRQDFPDAAAQRSGGTVVERHKRPHLGAGGRRGGRKKRRDFARRLSPYGTFERFPGQTQEISPRIGVQHRARLALPLRPTDCGDIADKARKVAVPVAGGRIRKPRQRSPLRKRTKRKFDWNTSADGCDCPFDTRDKPVRIAGGDEVERLAVHGGDLLAHLASAARAVGRIGKVHAVVRKVG